MHWVRIESTAYWVVFVVTFLTVGVWESFRARRALMVSVGRRWRNHALILIASATAGALIYRGSPVLVAVAFANSRFGLLNRPWLPFAARFVLTVFLLDFGKYIVHRVFHSVGFLWRFHSVHHSDPDFDVSTALRVHPLEQILVQGANLAAVMILAPPVVAVIAAEALAAFQSFFEHANADIPEWLERRLRWVLITPAFHRIHHSEEIEDQNRNFGEVFPWWDLWLGSYTARPAAGPDGMVTGLRGMQNDGSLRILFMFRQPFLREKPEAISVR